MTMEYKILTSVNHTVLQSEVNEHLSQHWRLAGNLSIAVDGPRQILYQPVKRHIPGTGKERKTSV